MKTRLHERLESLGRKYFEVFGDIEAENHFLKLLSIVITGILFLALLGAFILANRPPVVIRVAEVGKAEAIGNLRVNNAPTEHEVLYFSKTFVRRFSEYNACLLYTSDAADE